MYMFYIVSFLYYFWKDHKRLQVETLVLGMYERSVRNCPWCSQLWQRYVLAMERFHKPQKEIKGKLLVYVILLLLYYLLYPVHFHFTQRLNIFF